MRVKIYQINHERDKDKYAVKFFRLEMMQKTQGSPEIDASIYDEVFDAELEESGLEEIFGRFNQEGHPLHRGHSLSVSDIVVREDGAYFCQPAGFEKVDFDESLAHKPDDLIRVVYVEPHRTPYTAEIMNTLKGQQRAVGGRIQYLYNEDETIIVLNEEGKLNGSEGNRRIEGDVLCGSFFIAGDTGENLCSLTEEQIQKYSEKFAEPEEITPEEIELHTGFTLFSW